MALLGVCWVEAKCDEDMDTAEMGVLWWLWEPSEVVVRGLSPRRRRATSREEDMLSGWQE